MQTKFCSDDHEAIERLVTAEIEGYRSSDVDGLMAIRAREFVSVPPNQPAVSGHGAVRELIAGTIAAADIVDVQIAGQEIFGSGDLAIARVDVDMTFVPAGQDSPVSGRSKMMFVARRQDGGGWKWSHGIWNHG